MFFKHFANKNQPLGFYIIGTLVKNGLKSNPDKCHLLISSNENATVYFNEFEIENSKCEKLLGILNQIGS